MRQEEGGEVGIRCSCSDFVASTQSILHPTKILKFYFVLFTYLLTDFNIRKYFYTFWINDMVQGETV